MALRARLPNLLYAVFFRFLCFAACELAQFRLQVPYSAVFPKSSDAASSFAWVQAVTPDSAATAVYTRLIDGYAKLEKRVVAESDFDLD